MPWANLLAVFVVAVVTVILLKVLKPLIWLRYILYLSYMGISNVHGSQFRDFFLRIYNSICRMMVLEGLSTMSGLISCFSKDFGLNPFSLLLVRISEFYAVILKGILGMHGFLNVCPFI